MTLCYETLVDTGESDFIFFGSFIDPNNKDVLVVKDKKLILYRILRDRLSKAVGSPENVSLEEREGLIEHVHEYNVHGYIASCNKLSKLVHYESLLGRKESGEGEENKYIDGLVLLLENYTLLICYFNGLKGEFELVGRYNVHSMNLKDNEETGSSMLSGKEENKEKSEEQGEGKEYEDDVIIYDNEWEIYTKNNNCKVYYKNYLIIVKSKQQTLYIINAQSYHNVYEGGSREKSEVKMILTNYVKVNLNEKFNLDNNNLIKKVKLVKNYHSPLLCILITNYTELINSIPINSNADDESSCSLLVLKVDILTLNIVLINRTDNLLIDTEEVEGYYFQNFIGFIGHNNDFVYWFKLFDNSGRVSSKVHYQLTNIYGFFNNSLLKNEALTLINNTDLNTDLYHHNLHILNSELVLMLPRESRGGSVYLGKIVYSESNNLNNNKIVNIVWYKVSNKNLKGELVYGNCYDVLEAEDKLLILNTSSDNLVQLLLLENYADYMRDAKLSEYVEEFVNREGGTVAIKDLNLNLKFRHNNNEFEYFKKEPGKVALHQLTKIKSLGQLKMLNNFNYQPFIAVNLENLKENQEQKGVREDVQRELKTLHNKLKELREVKMNYVIGIRNARNVVKMTNKCVAHLQVVLMSDRGSGDLRLEDGKVVYNREHSLRLLGSNFYCSPVKRLNKANNEMDLVDSKLIVRGEEVATQVRFYDRFEGEYVSYVTEANTFCLYNWVKKKEVFKLNDLMSLNKRVYLKESETKPESRSVGEEILLCHLVNLKGTVFLVLLVTGHPVYLYKYFGLNKGEFLSGDFKDENSFFKLVKHNFVVPFPSLMLSHENNLYKLRLESSHRGGNGTSLSRELVVLPQVSVSSEMTVARFNGSESELLSTGDNHHREVIKAFRHRFDNFYHNYLNRNLLLLLKLEHNKLSVLNINVLVKYNNNNSTYKNNNNSNNNNNNTNYNNNEDLVNDGMDRCCYYLDCDDSSLYVLNQESGALYAYLLEPGYEYYYGNFRTFREGSLNVVCQESLNYLSQKPKGGSSGLDRSYRPREVNMSNDMLYEVYDSVNTTTNFLTVSNDYYWLNKTDNSLVPFSQGDSQSGRESELVLGRLICAVINLKDDILENLYNLLNLRNKLQLIHITNESTKLDKLNINKQLNIYIQYYQLISSILSNNNNNNSTVNGLCDVLEESGYNNNYVLLLHSSENFVFRDGWSDSKVKTESADQGGLKVLGYYKLNVFNNVLDAKFIHLYNREYVIVGTCTNLGEYVESNGDVMILDFMSNNQSNNSNYNNNYYNNSRLLDGMDMDLDNNSHNSTDAVYNKLFKNKREMELYYKKSFLYPITFVSSLNTQFNYRYNLNSKEEGGTLEDESEDTSEYGWLLNQLFGNEGNSNNNYVIHSVGNDIYIHEFKSFSKSTGKTTGPEKEPNSEKSFIRGAFNNLYTCVSSLCIFNNFLLVGDFLKGLSFFLYIYDNKNDNKSIVRIGSTNPKINLSVLACCPLISCNTLTLLASDNNNNLLQFVPNNNINSDKDKLILVNGIKFNNNITQLARYQLNFNSTSVREHTSDSTKGNQEDLYVIMGVENGGAIYKVFTLKNSVFNILKKFEIVYLSYAKSEHSQLQSHVNFYEFLNINSDPNLVNLQHHLPNNNNILLLLDLIKDVYFENAEFYKTLLTQLSLSQHSLYDLLNFIYKELYSF